MSEMSLNVPNCLTAADHLIEPAQAKSLLTERQQAAIELLLLGKSVTSTAEAIGVDRRTVHRWRHDEDFREELERRRNELWKDAADRLAGLVHPSLDVLERQLQDRYDFARFRAAAAVLRLADLRRTLGTGLTL